MLQIIVEQHFYYTAKMTSNKYFPNAIYANRDAKFSPAAAGKAHFTNRILMVAKIFINSAPDLLLKNDMNIDGNGNTTVILNWMAITIASSWKEIASHQNIEAKIKC